MSKIGDTLLTDTLNVIALARETALARGRQTQAERLAPVVDSLRTLAVTARRPNPPAAPTGALAGDGFQALLAATQAAPAAAPQSAPEDRSQVAVAMAAGGMTEIDIARQLGVTRDEVSLMLRPGQARGVAGGEKA